MTFSGEKKQYKGHACISKTFVFSARSGIKDSMVIQKLNERIDSALKMELSKNHPEDDQLRYELAQRLPIIQVLGIRHSEILNKFKQENPQVEFPALHKELFSQDGVDSQV